MQWYHVRQNAPSSGALWMLCTMSRILSLADLSADGQPCIWDERCRSPLATLRLSATRSCTQVGFLPLHLEPSARGVLRRFMRRRTYHHHIAQARPASPKASQGVFLLSQENVSVRIPRITRAGVTRYRPADSVHRRWLQNRAALPKPWRRRACAPLRIKLRRALNFAAACGRQNWRVSGLSSPAFASAAA